MHVKVHHEVSIHPPTGRRDWVLCLQWCTYVFDDHEDEHGYRFIWRRPDGTLQAARGQARIPGSDDLFELVEMAKRAGWFGHCERLDVG